MKFSFNVGETASETYEMLLERSSSQRHVEQRPLNGKHITRLTEFRLRSLNVLVARLKRLD